MIIYGRNGKVVAQQHVPHHTCTNCNLAGHTYLAVTSDYAHVYWIPFVSIGKTALTVCDNCQTKVYESKMEPKMRQEARLTKKSAKIPFYHFTGIAVVVFLMLQSALSEPSYSNAARIYPSKSFNEETPSITMGESYYFKKDGQYHLLKPSRIQGDSIFILNNIGTTPKIEELKNYDNNNYFVDMNVGMKLSEFEKLSKSQQIYPFH